MGGKDYSQKGIDNDRRIAGAERQAQGAYAQRVFATLVGREVNVASLGRCVVLEVNMAERFVVVRPVQGNQELYMAKFRAVALEIANTPAAGNEHEVTG
jgi:hypothetical protein